MSLSKRFFLLGSVLLLAALAFTFSPTTPGAHAASVSASTHALSMTPSAPSSSPRPQHEIAWADVHALSMTPSAVSPDFTCPGASICLFKNDDFTGEVLVCATNTCRGAWFSTTVGGVHAGSVNDNSNSVIVLGDVQDGIEVCLLPGRYKIDHSFGFFRVLFGVTSCPPPSQLPPLP